MTLPGGMEILLILLLIALIFGARKLPKIGEGLGKGIKNFKKEVSDHEQKDSDSQT